MSAATPKRRGRPPQEERPQRIADAALRLLAENGSRGLSHRRVDKEAGLPIGTTVHHAPRRNDLMLMAARRLTALSRQELLPFTEYMHARGDALTPDDIAQGMMMIWRARLAKDQLYRLRAELTLLLSQDVETELRDAIQLEIEMVLAMWRDLMARLGSRQPDVTAKEFGIWTRGLFYMLALQGGIAGDTKLSQVEGWITQILNAMLQKEDAAGCLPR